MKIIITRLDSTDMGVFGHLTLNGSPFNCVTLENHLLDIKEGEYACRLDMSPHLGYLTPRLIVPDRDKDAGGDAGIRIHILNREDQSQGCIGVGLCRDGFSIDNSRKAFEGLMKELEGCKDITVRIQ